MSEIRQKLGACHGDGAPVGVDSAYLFGSHAEGRAHRESDVDVGVLLDWARFPTADARFDVRVGLGSELIHATRGVRIYCSDPEADHVYARDVQLRAADLAPFLERMRRIELEALRQR